MCHLSVVTVRPSVAKLPRAKMYNGMVEFVFQVFIRRSAFGIPEVLATAGAGVVQTVMFKNFKRLHVCMI